LQLTKFLQRILVTESALNMLTTRRYSMPVIQLNCLPVNIWRRHWWIIARWWNARFFA